MMYGNTPDYQLAEKMKSRFSGRGAAVSGMRASTTSELMKRAQMGGDPSENCSELDFRNRAGQAGTGVSRPMYAYSAAGHSAGGNSAGGQRRSPDSRSRAQMGGNPNRTDPNPLYTGGTGTAPRTPHPGNGASAKRRTGTAGRNDSRSGVRNGRKPAKAAVQIDRKSVV